jgi:catechol 2,3-dioxygenase-like lactoylglutathione lyase family enzyme
MSDNDVNKSAFDSRDFSAIFDHASIGVRDIKRAIAFYEPTLATLGLEIVMDKGFAVAFGNGHGRQWLWISEPIDKDTDVVANNGAREDGAPGLRPEYIPTYYGTFVMDPDGNKIEAVCRRLEDD